jgi:hypothetical protein
MNNHDYQLKDFGRDEYKDPLVPVNILMVLMGFCILLFNKAVDFWSDPIKVSSVICGAFYLITYMFYLTEYYEKLWQPYFSLPRDKMFFRLYSLGIGIVIITCMQNFPQYWYAYVFVLFLFMYYKKKQTRDAFRAAMKNEFGNIGKCNNNVLLARYKLSEAFTNNFLLYGVVLNAIYSLGLFVLYKNNPHTYFQFMGEQLSLNYYVVVSSVLTCIIIFFWSKKITSGIDHMAKKVKEGDYEFFEKM